MTIVLSFQEIAQWRSQLFEYPDALKALDEIEDCDGDLEDAAIGLAIHAGQEPNTSERWLEGLAKRYRSIICQKDLKDCLLTGDWSKGFGELLEVNIGPPVLLAPVVIYVCKTGLETFCAPLEYKINPDS